MHAAHKPAILEDLRQQLERLERAQGAKVKGTSVLPFGIGALDELWPHGGLPRGAVHEIAWPANGLAAATGFAAAIAGRLKHMVLWCARARGESLYAPGLAAVGL